MSMQELEKLLGVKHHHVATPNKKVSNPLHRIVVTRKQIGMEYSLKIKGVNRVIVTKDKDYIFNSPPLELLTEMLGRKVSPFEASAIIRTIVKVVDID